MQFPSMVSNAEMGGQRQPIREAQNRTEKDIQSEQEDNTQKGRRRQKPYKGSSQILEGLSKIISDRYNR